MSRTPRSLRDGPQDGPVFASSAEPHARQNERICPICGKTARHELRPFCSSRCADVDLHRWLSESYAIPAAPDEADDLDDPAGHA
jgi:uncharacterized protein